MNKQIKDMQPWLIGLYRDLHQIPEINYQEFKTSAYIRQVLDELGYKYHIVGTGTILRIEGTERTRAVGFRADIDGLAIEEQYVSEFKSTHAGFMHACGHDAHATVLLGLARFLKDNPPKSDAVLVWQPAEEGGRGARVMVESGLCDADVYYALHISTYVDTGKFTCLTGVSQPSNQNLEIQFTGVGRHAQFRDGTRDALLGASHFLIESEKLNTPELLLHAGVLSGGTTVNSVAENATIKITLRSFAGEGLRAQAVAKLEQIIKDQAKHKRASGKLVFANEVCPAIVNSESAIAFAREKLADMNVKYFKGRVYGADDFSFFINKYSGAMIYLGAKPNDTVYPNHSGMFHIDDNCLKYGVQLYASLLN